MEKFKTLLYFLTLVLQFCMIVFSIEFELRDGVPLSLVSPDLRSCQGEWGWILCLSLAGFARVSWCINSFVLGCSLRPVGLFICVHSFVSLQMCSSVGFQVKLTLQCGWGHYPYPLCFMDSPQTRGL